jgi:hypothetical protein
VADHEVESKVGEVTGRIAPGTIGEVMIPIRGGREAFHAYAAEPDDVIEVGTEVLVVERVGARRRSHRPRGVRRRARRARQGDVAGRRA